MSKDVFNIIINVKRIAKTTTDKRKTFGAT